MAIRTCGVAAPDSIFVQREPAAIARVERHQTPTVAGKLMAKRARRSARRPSMWIGTRVSPPLSTGTPTTTPTPGTVCGGELSGGQPSGSAHGGRRRMFQAQHSTSSMFDWPLPSQSNTPVQALPGQEASAPSAPGRARRCEAVTVEVAIGHGADASRRHIHEQRDESPWWR